MTGLSRIVFILLIIGADAFAETPTKLTHFIPDEFHTGTGCAVEVKNPESKNWARKEAYVLIEQSKNNRDRYPPLMFIGGKKVQLVPIEKSKYLKCKNEKPGDVIEESYSSGDFKIYVKWVVSEVLPCKETDNDFFEGCMTVSYRVEMKVSNVKTKQTEAISGKGSCSC